MVQISAGGVNGATREGGEVPDRLYYGFRFMDLPKCGRPIPKSQLRPIHGHGLHARRLTKVSLTLPQVKDTSQTTNARTSDEDASRQDIRQFAARRAKDGQTGGVPQRVDLGEDVETCQQESLRKYRTQAVSDEVKTTGMGDQGGVEGIQATAGGDWGRGCGAAFE